MNSNSVLKRALPSIIGAQVERNIETFLNGRDLRTICRNYKCCTSEFDLVMNGDYLVFVEVGYRGGDAYGGSVESIPARKQKQLIRAVTHFRATEEPHFQGIPCRFDSVGVSKANGPNKYDRCKTRV